MIFINFVIWDNVFKNRPSKVRMTAFKKFNKSKILLGLFLNISSHLEILSVLYIQDLACSRVFFAETFVWFIVS